MASELVFINLSGPDDSKSEDKRKAVRSQAAKDHSQSSSGQQSTRRRRRKLLSVELEVDVSESSSGSGSPRLDESPTDPGASSDLSRIEEKAKEENFDRHVGEVARVGFGNMPGAGWTHPFVPYPDKTFVPAILAHCKSTPAVFCAIENLSEVFAQFYCWTSSWTGRPFRNGSRHP